MKHLLLGVFLLFGLHTYSQSWTFPVSGRVTNGGKKLDRANVTLFKSGTQVNQVVTSSNGKFEFVLEPDADYIITVTKPGFITKKFSFNTQNVPSDRAKQGFGGVDLSEIVIFEIPKGVDVNELNNILSQPIAKFAYQDAGKDFNYDENYTRSIRSKLDKLADVQKKAEEEDKKKSEGDKAITEKFNSVVSKADKAFTAKDYVAAKAAYNEALGLKPGESSIKSKLTEIDNLIAKEAAEKANAAKEKELNAKYTAAITKADQSLAAKDYNGAKANYTEALGLKPAEKYPKDKLTEIDKIIADIAAKEAAEKANAAKEKELNAKYSVAITKADQSLAAKDYNGAKASYTEALGLKPAEKYPKDKLTEIDKILADIAAKEAAEKANAAKEKELNVKYTAAITKADQSLAAKDYNGAKAGYTEALGLKPAEKYPKDKLAEIDKILADIAAKEAAEKSNAAREKELNAKYGAAIARADKAFAANDLLSAKSSYSEAAGLKPAEKYPQDKLAEIEKIMSEKAAKAASEKERAAKEKELNDKYAAAIAKGDKAFTMKDYLGAKSAYNEAVTLKLNEEYPKTKLNEIEKLLSDAANKEASEKEKAAREKEINEKYTLAMTRGNKSLTAKDYEGAKTAYNEALTLKPLEQLPKDKLAEIQKLLQAAEADKASAVKEKELNDKYNAAIASGDKAFLAKDYTSAKTGYTTALTLKPAEKYPQDKLAEIEKILADITAKESAQKEKKAKEDEINSNYNAAITKADKAFSAKSYTSAQALYSEASGIKPAEKYPKDKMMEIERLLDEQSARDADKARQEKYKALIDKADKQFNGKEYKAARLIYQEASGVRSSEKYPKDKIAEIDGILNKLKTVTTGTSVVAAAIVPPKDNDPVKKQEYVNALVLKYPQGVTEEQFQEGNCKILKRVVVKGNNAATYKKSMWAWGGVFYFKDDMSITEAAFNSETQ